ncbi:Hypothetical protein FKW44_020835, partial [Caligus rogercresseyi]
RGTKFPPLVFVKGVLSFVSKIGFPILIFVIGVIFLVFRKAPPTITSSILKTCSS